MGGFSAVYGAYNVQGSLNQWFVKNITALGTPTWMPASARVLFDWGKDRPIISGYSGAAFTLSHMPDRTRESYQGGRADNGSAGATRAGMVDISCWISRQVAGESYIAKLRQMRDMVDSLWQSTQTLPYANIYAATAGTASATARMVLEDIEFQPEQQDGHNADLYRIRAVANYSWVRRV